MSDEIFKNNKKLLESMNKISEPFKEYAIMIKTINEQTERMRSICDFGKDRNILIGAGKNHEIMMKAMNEQTERMGSIFKDIDKDRSALMGVGKSHEIMMKSMNEQNERMRSLFRNIGKDLVPLTEVTKNYVNVARSISEQAEHIRSTYSGIGRHISPLIGISDGYKDLFKDGTFQKSINSLLENLKDSREVITLEDYNALEEELSNAEACLQSEVGQGLSLELRLYKYLETLIGEFRKKNPIISIIIWLFIIVPICDEMSEVVRSNFKVVSSFAIEKVKHEIEDNNLHELNKKIRDSVTKNINAITEISSTKKDIYNKFRFVKHNNLSIRLNKSIKSLELYKLEYGDIVTIIYKNKNWTLIEYENDDNKTIKGWVLTRYISRFD